MPTLLSTNEAKPTFSFENKPGNVVIQHLSNERFKHIKMEQFLFLIQKPDRVKEPSHT